MADYSVVQILDLLENIGEEEVAAILSDFSCDKNTEIECFIKNRALDFAKQKQSITHLVFDEDNGNMVGFFSLTHKPISVKDDILSATANKKIRKFSKYDEELGAYTLSAFLIAQFGKNYSIDENERISGNELMDIAYDILKDVQHQIGGSVVFLECEQQEKLLCFYQNEPHPFKCFGERYSDNDGVKYIQLLGFV